MTGWATALSAKSGDLTFVVHRGDRAALLAMDLPKASADRLAGFALLRKRPGGQIEPIKNRLTFVQVATITSETTPEERKWYDSTDAPFQKFRWVDVPTDFKTGKYEYTAVARYFKADGTLRDGDSATISIDISKKPGTKLTVGFTRGYMSSQAYADQFQNAPFRPKDPAIDFDTKPYRRQYEWLGFHAREIIERFLKDCVSDPSVSVDAFAYDLNDPDIINAFKALKGRLRLFLDDATLHRDHLDDGKMVHPLEPVAAAAITAAGGAVKRGHFGRFAHSKVFIAKRNGAAFKVLTGSTNFSLRGLYVQANNVLAFDAPEVAAKFEEAFAQTWEDPSHFRTAPIANAWFDLPAAGFPPGAIAFSPHTSADISLSRVATAISGAQSSLLFSVMGLDGGGDVLKKLREGVQMPGLFSYGVTQSDTFMSLYKPGAATPVRVPYAYLKSKVPWPFRKEISGGAGQVIHDKFVVVDFNGPNAAVYTGSSNLAKGGEEDNGDNLIELLGPQAASLYAVDAVKQIDHFHFRAAMRDATDAKPLVLKGPNEWHEWVDPYYDPNDLKFLDRQLFAKPS